VRESTAQWLSPMLDAAREHGVDTSLLMTQATMPLAEAGDLLWAAWFQRTAPEGARSGAIDWIRFGELLRERLGWADYPEWPTEDN